MTQQNDYINKYAGLLDWDDLADYVQTLINKSEQGFELSKEEEAVIKETPKEVMDYALDQAVSAEPLDPTPKVKRVKKKRPEEKPLTPEEKQQLIEDSPELTVLNAFIPEILDDSIFMTEPNPHMIDASITVFEYLKAFGYEKGLWVIGPEHKALLVPRNEMKDHCRPIIDGIPICDLLHSQELKLDDIITKAYDHASEKGYYPPRGITAQSHPGCRCYILCYPPDSAEKIPDSAPGVPTFGSAEEKLYYKQLIYERLQNYPVDRFTFLNPVIYEAAGTLEGHVVDEYDLVHSEYEYGGEAILDDLYSRKRKSEAVWRDYVLPVRVSEGYIYKHSLGFVRPVPTTYKGFQVASNGEFSKIFLGDLNRYIYAPVNAIKAVNLKVSSKEMQGGDFIKVDDTVGLAIGVTPHDKIICYLPEFKEIMLVGSDEVFTVYETS